MDGFGNVLSRWTVTPFVGAAAIAVALWANVPVYVLLGMAAIFALTAVVAHSPMSAAGRAIALSAVGLAWLAAPLSGIGVSGRLTLPEVMLIPAAVCALMSPVRRMGADQALRSAPVGFLLLIAIGGIIGAFADGLNTGNLLYVARFIFNGLVSLLVLRRLNPSGRELQWLALAWVGGVTASALVGLAGPAGPSGRSVGLAGHANQLAMMAAMALPVVAALAFRNRSAVVRNRPAVDRNELAASYESRAVRDGPIARWLIAAAVACVLSAAVFASGSRSGLLAVVVVIALVAFRYLGAPIAVAAGALAVTAVFLAGVPQALSEEGGTSAFARFASAESTEVSDEGRTELLRAQLTALTDMTAVVGSGFEIDVTRPHNVFLQVWGAAGIVGLIGLAGLVVPIVACALRRRGDIHPMAVAVAIGFVGYLVAVSFNNAFEFPFVWTFYALWERWRTIHA